jgi:hypothetical protein
MNGAHNIGIYAELQERRARIAAANPHLALKLTGRPAPVAAQPIVIRDRPIPERGRYIPRTLNGLVAFIARQTDLHPDAIYGNGRTRRLVDARSCIAVLAQVYAPRLSAAAIDDGMCRGSGTCIWYRARHLDRLKLYPEYAGMFVRCEFELARGRS